MTDNIFNVNIKELFSSSGRCYVIETNYSKFGKQDDFTLIITRLPILEIKSLHLYLSSKYDILGILTNKWLDVVPWSFIATFGKENLLVTFQENKINRIKCQNSDPNYISIQQCFSEIVINMTQSLNECSCVPFWFRGVEQATNSSITVCYDYYDELCASSNTPQYFERSKSCQRSAFMIQSKLSEFQQP